MSYSHQTQKNIIWTLIVIVSLSGLTLLAQERNSEKGQKPPKTRTYTLFAKGQPAPVTQIVELHFNKKYQYPNTCFTTEQMQFGNTLVCPIDLDAENVPSGLRILDVHGWCSPNPPGDPGPCAHTKECPGGGICDKHLYKSQPDPNQLANGNYRKASWYGWTNDGNNALLTIKVLVGP
jgi:hypothetical protein